MSVIFDTIKIPGYEYEEIDIAAPDYDVEHWIQLRQNDGRVSFPRCVIPDLIAKLQKVYDR